jgi:putative transposase
MRKPRLEHPGALYHVIARGNQRQNVFREDGDYVKYLKLLGSHLEGRRFILYAYCLMTNHVHLLIEQGSSFPLSKYMQRLQSAYTNFFNNKYGKSGHLFQGRYKGILVDKDGYLLELVRYIHQNPQRAKMEDAGRYPWTSHWQYLGKEKEPLAKVETGAVLDMFSKIKPVARGKYRGYMKERQGQSKKAVLYDLRDGRILGDEEFEKETLKRAGRKGVETTLKTNKGIGQFWKAILEREGLKKEPEGWGRSRLMGEVAYVAAEEGRIRQKEVADYFGVEPTALNKAVKRLEGRWAKGIGSRERLMRWARGL